MKVLEARNAHNALPEALRALSLYGEERPSRNGPVIQFNEPLTTFYRQPRERVIFHARRDANPFFHFFESLWMLAGRRDVDFVARFNAKMRDYSDDGTTFNAAYGYRWRNHFGVDQLRTVTERLRDKPECRRQVIGIWDPRQDLGLDSKDLPCNTQAMVQRAGDGSLDLFATNRSNDLIWGTYGANVVQFSMLHEYLAARVGCEVGRYWQVSMNSHVYLELYNGRELINELAAPDRPGATVPSPYEQGTVEPFPLVSIRPNIWDRELSLFVDGQLVTSYTDPFFLNVAVPMQNAWKEFKWSRNGAARCARARAALAEVAATDWRLAADEWLARREERAA